MGDLSIGYLLKIIWKKIWLILGASILAGLLALGVSLISTPIYTATASIFVTNGGLVPDADEPPSSSSLKSTDFAASFAMLQPCVDLLETPEIYKTVAAEVGGATAKQLASGIRLTIRSDDSLFIDIEASNVSQADAVRIANAFAAAAPDYIVQQLPAARITVPELAEEAKKTMPRTKLNVVIFAAIGMLFACVAVLLTTLLDQTIKSEAEFTQTYEIPLLGSVPDFGATVKKGGRSA